VNWLRVISLTVLVLLLVPIVVLVYYGLGPLRTPMGYGTAVFKAVALSLTASVLAVAVDFVLFTPLAYYLARERNLVAEALADVPASVPHPIIGVALVLLDSPLTPTGRFLNSIGLNFFDSMSGLVTALVIISAPIYLKAMQPYFASRDASPEEFARGMGASHLRTFVSVVLPDSFQGVTSASLIATSRAMSEFGSISIIAYYVLQFPFYGVYPASVLIYQYYTAFGLGAAVTSSVVLVLVSLPIALAVKLIPRDRGRR
jgi:molybdate/tungstate transport system permease protein